MDWLVALLSSVGMCAVVFGLFWLTYFILSIFGQEDKLRAVFMGELLFLLLLAIIGVVYLLRLEAGAVPDYFHIMESTR